MTLYNANDAHGITTLFSDVWRSLKEKLWTDRIQKEVFSEYGKMTAFKYMGVYEGQERIAYFKITYDKSEHMISLTLEWFHKLGTFRFHTSSPYYTDLLAQEK